MTDSFKYFYCSVLRYPAQFKRCKTEFPRIVAYIDLKRCTAFTGI